MINNRITDPEVTQLVSLLKRLDPGFYPLEVFWQFCRLIKTTAVEVIPFVRDSEGKIKVVLIKRSEEDEFWPGMYHTPGCMVRPQDTANETVDRVIINELRNPQVIQGPSFVNFIFLKTQRGESVALLHWVELEGDIPEGELFDYDSLPSNFIQEQRILIEEAIKDYIK